MNRERVYQIIKAPHVSEKSARLGDGNNFVVFRVLPDATKDEIRVAVETLFEVKVRDVKTALMKGKAKRFGRMTGKRSDWKKAYVALEPGQEIDFAGGE